MRQEIIATTGQMHAMRDNFVTKIDDTSKEVEDHTEELTARIKELEEKIELQVSNAEIISAWKILIDSIEFHSIC